jgi:UDP-N-acetylglucosamine:LPS N-acetylglucosamine transferase
MAKILILTSKTGGGHVSLAEALRDQLAGAHAVQIIDPQPRVVHWHYRLASRHALWLWAAEFRAANTAARALRAHQLFTVLFGRNLGGLLARSQPEVVLTTYPFLAYEVTHAMRASGQRVPFAQLFSDPNEVHQAWLSEPNATATFAPTRETFEQARQAGFAPERLHLTGWPVRQQFQAAAQAAGDTRASTLAGLGLNAGAFTVFLQGGAEGAAQFARTAAALLAVDGLQVILATGTNRALFHRFDGQPRIRPLAFTKAIAPYMAAADVIMGKAGPNMLFEAATLGKPFIATTYIPGQEAGNLDFIRRHGLGWAALNAREQESLARRLLAQPAELNAMRATVNDYAAWNTAATERIHELVANLIQGQPSSSAHTALA